MLLPRLSPRRPLLAHVVNALSKAMCYYGLRMRVKKQKHSYTHPQSYKQITPGKNLEHKPESSLALEGKRVTFAETFRSRSRLYPYPLRGKEIQFSLQLVTSLPNNPSTTME